jgi:hypothetical protein
LEKGLQSAQQELSRYAAQVAGTQQKIADIGKQADAPFQAGAAAPAPRSARVVGKAIPVRAVMAGSRWRCRHWLGARRAIHRFKFNLSRPSDTGSPAGQPIHRQAEPFMKPISGWLLNP